MVIETTEVLDQAKMMAVDPEASPELMMFTDGTTLIVAAVAGGCERAVEAALAERGIPLAAVTKMKPWMLSAMVALPACEMARKAAGAPVLDVKLAEDAQGRRQEALRGWRPSPISSRAMASLPMEFHLKGLVETLKLGDRMDDVVETMIGLYSAGDTGMFWPLFRAVLPNEAEDEAGLRRLRGGDDQPRATRRWRRRPRPILDRRQRLHRRRRAAPAGTGGVGRIVPARLATPPRRRAEASVGDGPAAIETARAVPGEGGLFKVPSMELASLLGFAGALLYGRRLPGPSIAALVARVISQGFRDVFPFLAAMWIGEAIWLVHGGVRPRLRGADLPPSPSSS